MAAFGADNKLTTSVVLPIVSDLQSRSSYGFCLDSTRPHEPSWLLWVVHDPCRNLPLPASPLHLGFAAAASGVPLTPCRLLEDCFLLLASLGVRPWVCTGYQFGLPGPPLGLILLMSPVWHLHLLWAAFSAPDFSSGPLPMRSSSMDLLPLWLLGYHCSRWISSAVAGQFLSLVVFWSAPLACPARAPACLEATWHTGFLALGTRCLFTIVPICRLGLTYA